jgi:hypothetical protein
MKTCRISRRVSQLALAVLLAGLAAGCASTKAQSSTPAYQGPIEEPKKKSTFWSVVGFIFTPIANFLTTGDDK